MILRQGLVPACTGIAIGLVLSVATMRLLPMLAPFTHRIDPRWYVVMVPMLLIVSAIASLVPARQVARVDPAAVLRQE